MDNIDLLRIISDAVEARLTAPAPADTLVERVANVFLCKPFSEDDPLGARAAIHVVAAWLRENDSVWQMGGDAAATADLLDEVAI